MHQRPATATIHVPQRLRSALGDDPAQPIATLVELQKTLGGRSVEAVRENPFLDVQLDAHTKYRPFATSTLVELRTYRGTQRIGTLR